MVDGDATDGRLTVEKAGFVRVYPGKLSRTPSGEEDYIICVRGAHHPVCSALEAGKEPRSTTGFSADCPETSAARSPVVHPRPATTPLGRAFISKRIPGLNVETKEAEGWCRCQAPQESLCLMRLARLRSV